MNGRREASGRSLVKGVVLSLTAAAAHHVTLIFGVVFFAAPVLWIACADAREEGRDTSVGGVLSRALLFAGVVGIGVGIVLLPYWMALIQHPIHQIPIPHDSRANFLLNSITAINYFVIPFGAMILALPFILIRGASVPRLRPLLIGFWLSMIFGLGGTTPLPQMASWSRLRNFDLRAVHLLGDAFGNADRWPARGSITRSFPRQGRCGIVAGRSRHHRCGIVLAHGKSLSLGRDHGRQSRDFLSES